MLEKFLNNVERYYNLPENWKKQRGYFYVFIRSAVVSVLYEAGYGQKEVSRLLEKDHSTLSTITSRHTNGEYLDLKNAVYEIYLHTVLESTEDAICKYVHIVSCIKRRIESDEAHPVLISGAHIDRQEMKTAKEAIEFALSNLGANSEILLDPLFEKFKKEYYAKRRTEAKDEGNNREESKATEAGT